MVQDGILDPRAQSDPELDVNWSWLGLGTRNGPRTYHDHVQAVRTRDGAARVFQTGDAVCVAGVGGQLWVGHLISMFHVGADVDDDEVQVVETAVETLSRMRCSLRWFYSADDPSIGDSRRVSPGIPPPEAHELYFSDLVEEDGTNCVDIIQGRAFLCPAARDLRKAAAHPPQQFHDGDVFRLVRCFYGNNSGRPPPIRELATGELEILLSNPSDEADLYDRARLFLYGPAGAVIKGAGRKKRFPCLPETVATSPLKVDDISARSSIQPALIAPEILERPKPAVGMLQECAFSQFGLLQQQYLKSTDLARCLTATDDGMPIPPMIQNELANTVRGSFEKGEKRALLISPLHVESHPSASLHAPSLEQVSKIFCDVPTITFNTKAEHDRPVEYETENDSKRGPMREGWSAVIARLAEGTPQQKEACIRNLPRMLSLFRTIMQDQNLDFTMCRDSTKTVAKIAALHVLNSISPTPSSAGGSSSLSL